MNDLKGLGKSFEIIKLVKKILRSLPNLWMMKVTTIEKSKDLSKIGMDELIRSLLTNEMKRKPKKKKKKLRQKEILP